MGFNVDVPPDQHELPFTDWQRGVDALCAIIALSGLVLNTVMLTVMARDAKLRTQSGIGLMLSLCVADIGVGASNTLVHGANTIGGGWAIGQWGCAFASMISIFFCACEVQFLAWLALERYWLVARRWRLSTTAWRVALLFTWCSCGFMATAPFWGWGVFGLQPSGLLCVTWWWDRSTPSSPAYVSILGVMLMAPLMTSFICYWYLYKYIRENSYDAKYAGLAAAKHALVTAAAPATLHPAAGSADAVQPIGRDGSVLPISGGRGNGHGRTPSVVTIGVRAATKQKPAHAHAHAHANPNATPAEADAVVLPPGALAPTGVLSLLHHYASPSVSGEVAYAFALGGSVTPGDATPIAHAALDGGERSPLPGASAAASPTHAPQAAASNPFATTATAAAVTPGTTERHSTETVFASANAATGTPVTGPVPPQVHLPPLLNPHTHPHPHGHAHVHAHVPVHSHPHPHSHSQPPPLATVPDGAPLPKSSPVSTIGLAPSPRASDAKTAPVRPAVARQGSLFATATGSGRAADGPGGGHNYGHDNGTGSGSGPIAGAGALAVPGAGSVKGLALDTGAGIGTVTGAAPGTGLGSRIMGLSIAPVPYVSPVHVVTGYNGIAIANGAAFTAAAVAATNANAQAMAVLHAQYRERRREARDREIGKKMLALALAFGVCWGPYAVQMIGQLLWGQRFPNWWDALSIACAYTNALANPLLFCYINRRIRALLCNVCCCCCLCGSRVVRVLRPVVAAGPNGTAILMGETPTHTSVVDHPNAHAAAHQPPTHHRAASAAGRIPASAVGMGNAVAATGLVLIAGAPAMAGVAEELTTTTQHIGTSVHAQP